MVQKNDKWDSAERGAHKHNKLQQPTTPNNTRKVTHTQMCLNYNSHDFHKIHEHKPQNHHSNLVKHRARHLDIPAEDLAPPHVPMGAPQRSLRAGLEGHPLWQFNFHLTQCYWLTS